MPNEEVDPDNPPVPQNRLGHNGLQGITLALFSVHNGLLGAFLRTDTDM